MSEADELERAQAALLRRRAELARASSSPLAPAADALVSLCDAVPVQIPPRCGCGANLWGAERERGQCGPCAAGGVRAARARELRERIPEWFRWATLGQPMVPPGGREPALLDDESARSAAVRWLDGGPPLLTICGPTGAGKTTLLSAIGNVMIDRGMEPMWIDARELSPDFQDKERAALAMRRAEASRVLLVDGLGKELAGAGDGHGDGVAAQRRVWVQNWIGAIHGATRRKIAISNDMAPRVLRSVYGLDAARRLIGDGPHVRVINLKARKVKVLDDDSMRFADR